MQKSIIFLIPNTLQHPKKKNKLIAKPIILLLGVFGDFSKEQGCIVKVFCIEELIIGSYFRDLFLLSHAYLTGGSIQHQIY